MKSIFISLILSFSLLTACGGGGGGGGGKTTPTSTASSSSTATTTLTANAGADITVDMGATVSLNPQVLVTNPSGFNAGSGNVEITGSSTKSSDIVKLKWTKQSGPSFGVTTSDTTSGKFSFTAPTTGTENSIQIIYQLTLTNAAGQTASDAITITVNRVNAVPVANASDDQNVESEVAVTLSASASTDADGTLASYAWTQTSGDSITLTDADKATATFTAPDVTEPTSFEFQLTVTDNDGATATDNVIVIVTAKDAPLISIYFPTPVGVYKDATISAFGSAEAVDANLSKVEVSVGGDFIEATLADGKWRLDDIAVPDTETFELTVKVTDSLGKVSQKKSSLKKSGTQGSGQSWTKMIALGIDNENQRVLAFASGTKLSDFRVFPIALSSGSRGNDLSNFNQSNQGVQTYVIAKAHYDEAATSFYYTLNPDDLLAKLQLNELNVLTGQRKIIAENDSITINATPTTFVNPAGVVTNQNGQIFIADNGSGKILRIEASTGVRTVIGNLSGAIGLAMDPTQLNSIFAMSYSASSYVYKVLLDVNPITSSIVTDSDISGQGPVIVHAEDMEVDTTLNTLFLIDNTNQLFEADITSGMRTKIESVSVAGKGYDHNRHLFYYNDKNKNAIYVLDPISKHKVMISGSVD